MGLLPDPVCDVTRIVNGVVGLYQPTKTQEIAEMAKKTRKAKVEEVDEVEETDDDVELEDLDTEVEDDEAPASSKASEVTFGVADLVKYLDEKHDVETTPRELRTLIRKMAREDTPRINREIVPGNRSRYDWPDGVKDPEVKAIIKAVTQGEMEADKKAKLEQLKKDKAAKAAKAEKAPAAKKGKKGKKKKAQPEPEPEELEDDEVEEIEFDEDDED
jgi:hypothetical protein